MQIATAPTSAQRPDLAGLKLGSASLAPETDVHYKVVTSARPVGARQGYASLDQATHALRNLTSGDAPAAGIFASGGRYYGQQLDLRYRPVGPNGELYNWTQEPFDAEGVVIDRLHAYRQGPVAQQLVGMVDGGQTLWSA